MVRALLQGSFPRHLKKRELSCVLSLVAYLWGVGTSYLFY